MATGDGRRATGDGRRESDAWLTAMVVLAFVGFLSLTYWIGSEEKGPLEVQLSTLTRVGAGKFEGIVHVQNRSAEDRCLEAIELAVPCRVVVRPDAFPFALSSGEAAKFRFTFESNPNGLLSIARRRLTRDVELAIHHQRVAADAQPRDPETLVDVREISAIFESPVKASAEGFYFTWFDGNRYAGNVTRRIQLEIAHKFVSADVSVVPPSNELKVGLERTEDAGKLAITLTELVANWREPTRPTTSRDLGISSEKQCRIRFKATIEGQPFEFDFSVQRNGLERLLVGSRNCVWLPRMGTAEFQVRHRPYETTVAYSMVVAGEQIPIYPERQSPTHASMQLSVASLEKDSRLDLTLPEYQPATLVVAADGHAIEQADFFLLR